MDEYLDIWNDIGLPTGKKCLKDEAHQKGWFHPTVHIWFYTDTPSLLLQKRGLSKQTYPGFWDVSVAGHVSAGETILEGALREVKEEIGLDIKQKDLNTKEWECIYNARSQCKKNGWHNINREVQK